MKIVNWYRLVSANPNQSMVTKKGHRLILIGWHNKLEQTSRKLQYLSDHPPFLGSPGDEFGKKFWPSLLNTKNKHCCMVTRITHLPIIAFPFHYVYTRSPGRGSTEYEMRRQMLSSLLFWGECRSCLAHIWPTLAESWIKLSLVQLNSSFNSRWVFIHVYSPQAKSHLKINVSNFRI